MWRHFDQKTKNDLNFLKTLSIIIFIYINNVRFIKLVPYFMTSDFLEVCESKASYYLFMSLLGSLFFHIPCIIRICLSDALNLALYFLDVLSYT